jgi:hypothetical protein
VGPAGSRFQVRRRTNPEVGPGHEGGTEDLIRYAVGMGEPRPTQENRLRFELLLIFALASAEASASPPAAWSAAAAVPPDALDLPTGPPSSRFT